MASSEPPIERTLSLSGVALRPGAASFHEKLTAGEIVGVAGLDGHGQEEFLELAAGIRFPPSGIVAVESEGQSARIANYGQAVRTGIAYLARDRQRHGVFQPMSILDNFSMASWRDYTRLGLLSKGLQRRGFEAWRERLEIVAADPRLPITALSGGNQQKVLLARLLALEPRFLLLNDPTRGVDQRTREILYRTFRDLAHEQGLCVAILSTEIEEILRLCDRVIVFRDGEISERLTKAKLTSNHVIAAMFGQAA